MQLINISSSLFTQKKKRDLIKTSKIIKIEIWTSTCETRSRVNKGHESSHHQLQYLLPRRTG